MRGGFTSAHAPTSAAVAVWQDPRDRVCIAIGGGHPVSLDRTAARELCEELVRASKRATADAAQGKARRATVYARSDATVKVYTDTSRSYVHKRRDLKAKAPAGPMPMVVLEVQGEQTTQHAMDAAATAHKIGRYATRPYVRKVQGVHDGV